MQQQNLQYRPLWLAIGWLLVAYVWYVCLIPNPPQIDIGISFFDKIIHFTSYAAMMGWFMQLYPALRTRLLYAAGFIAMGISIEFLQGLGVSRMFEVADMLANGLGVVTMLLFVNTGFGSLLLKAEQKISNTNP